MRQRKQRPRCSRGGSPTQTRPSHSVDSCTQWFLYHCQIQIVILVNVAAARSSFARSNQKGRHNSASLREGHAKENAPVGRALPKLRADPGRARRQEAREVADKMKDWLKTHAAKHRIHNHRGVIPHIVDVVRPRCAAWSDALPAVRETVGLARCCAILHSQRHVPVNPPVGACTGKPDF